MGIKGGTYFYVNCVEINIVLKCIFQGSFFFFNSLYSPYLSDPLLHVAMVKKKDTPLIKDLGNNEILLPVRGRLEL